MRLALTGSIGMGKSTVAKMFERAGVPVFDADAVVRDLQANDPALISAIGERFPGTLTNGVLDRERLTLKVLGFPAELEALEAIVHPAVHHERTRFIVEHGDSPALLFDIPLLFETGGDQAFDKVIVVSASPRLQRDRVMARPGMTVEKFEQILARQLPDEKKRERADFVVDTSGTMDETRAQVRNILTCLGLPTGV